jgi:hypothetical protein
MSNPPKSKWRWRILRWGFISLVVLVTLAAIAITEENWRGKRDWEAYKKAAEARGEIIDQFNAATNPVPDDQNFAKAPVAMNLSSTFSDGSGPVGDGGGWRRGRFVKLSDWQNYYRNPPTNLSREFPVAPQPQSPGADVLLALSKYDLAIEGWRQASLRPYAQFADYGPNPAGAMSHLLPNLAAFKRCFLVLQLRALAELSEGQNNRALADVQLMLRLNDKLGEDPLLISHLVRMATQNLLLQPVYEGLVRHQWSDAQLIELQKSLAGQDFLADYERAMRGERAYAISYLENLRRTRQMVSAGQNSGDALVTNSFRLAPAAFFYQNELASARLAEKYALPLVDLDRRILSPSAVRDAEAAMQSESRHYRPYSILALETQPVHATVTLKFAEAQTFADVAQVACALERYRLAQGGYPETLEALAPQYIDKLPHDIINGQPLNYRHTDGGNYIVYSVGWNEKDDGGKLGLTKGGTIDNKTGDWVWNSAAQ